MRSDYLSTVPLVFFFAFVSAAIGLGVSGALLVGMGAMGAVLGLGVYGPIAQRADMRRGIRAVEDYLRTHAAR